MPKGRRYLSPYESIHAWMAEDRESLSFHGSSRADWERWEGRFRPRLLELLGRWPDPVPLEPEVLEVTDCGDYTREKVVFDSDRHASVIAYVLTPKGIAPGERRPVVLAAHGHGNGKSDICGVAETPEQAHLVRQLRYDYAVRFVERGWCVIAPDWRGFGERRSPAEWARTGRDPCNVNYMAMGYAGYHLLTLQIWDGMRCLDYMATRPECDLARVAVGGLSFGGTMSTYLGALEERIGVVCISGYLSTVGDAIGMRGLGNFCGAQYMPGLLTIGDIPDVASLICPKPLVVEMGEQDQCFVIGDMLPAFERVQRVYQAAGCAERLEADVHPGAHEWSGRKSLDWFARWL